MKHHPCKLIHAAGSQCPKCGGFVGGHSDMCHDCDYVDGLTWRDWLILGPVIAVFVYGFGSMV